MQKFKDKVDTRHNV